MKSSVAAAAVLGVCLLAVSARSDDVVINEIMYHPLHSITEAEDTGKEWIELFNRGTNTVNLTGWRLTKGVDFTFTNTSIAPGGYLVVAANRTNFLSVYPAVTNVVGNWTGRLANSDDEISLVNTIGE